MSNYRLKQQTAFSLNEICFYSGDHIYLIGSGPPGQVAGRLGWVRIKSTKLYKKNPKALDRKLIMIY
jgi:hypothetical protein